MPDTSQPALAEVYANNIGYETGGPKQAVIGTREPRVDDSGFHVVDARTAERVFSGRLQPAAAVADWRASEDPAVADHFWVADFSALTTPGSYLLQVGDHPGDQVMTGRAGTDRIVPVGRSLPFRIADEVLERFTLSDVIHYLKGSRVTGQYEKWDRSLPVASGSDEHVDARGGWLDASGDYGVHFTNQATTISLTTTQVPLIAWLCLESYRALQRRGATVAVAGTPGNRFTSLGTWLLDEALFGADYAVRMRVPGGTFRSGVMHMGLDKRTQERVLDPLPVSFRGGAGQAIAALARAATLPVSGDYPAGTYLDTAREVFAYLTEHNTEHTHDGAENLIDDYDACLAATELYAATGEAGYLEAAAGRARRICARLDPAEGYWRIGDGERPYFNPANAGMPVISLLRFAELADGDDAELARASARRSLEHELTITDATSNPFGYARQVVCDADGNRYAGFFMPHDAGDTAYLEAGSWWQGENARIASLAAAARAGAHAFGDGAGLGGAAFAARLERYAYNQLSWVLGQNPYAVCMLAGAGINNPQYLYRGSWRYLSYAGGIANGITGRERDGSGIQWDYGYAASGEDSDWRWTEQWLPHATWFMYAVALGRSGGPARSAPA